MGVEDMEQWHCDRADCEAIATLSFVLSENLLPRFGEICGQN